MSTRIINRDRRRNWRYYKIFCKIFLYLGIFSLIAAAPVIVFTISGQWKSLFLLSVLLLLSGLFFALYAYFIDKYKR